MVHKQIRPALLIFLMLTVITGVLYPLSVTAIAQGFFGHQANGSLIYQNGRTAGSELIGQLFEDPQYLWGRPSATSGVPYNAASSSGSNYGPMNPDFIRTVKERIRSLKEADPENTALIPTDLVTASGSGLDPHISPAAAYYQLPRIAKAREMSETELKEIVRRYTQGRFLGILGEPVVNVLKVNIALDEKRK